MNVEALSHELEHDEGLRLKLYQDIFGNWTIGVGRNLSGRGISRDEALYLLKNDIVGTLDELDRHLPWWRTLDEVRQRALANMCFNLGIERLLGFKKFLAALKAGNYGIAADEMAHSKWDGEVGARAYRLEAAMRSGQAEAI